MAIDDNTSYELTGYQVKDLAGRIRLKADANSVPTSISDLGQVTASDIDTSTLPGANGVTTLTGSMSGTSWADVSNCSFTTTKAGLYWIGYEISSAYVGAHEFSINGRISIGGTNYAGCSQFSIKNWAGNYGASNSNSIIHWIPANTTVKMQASMSNYSGGVNCTMNYIQIY